MKKLKDILKRSGADFELAEKKLDESHLDKSPTILINGRDIEDIVGKAAAQKSACSACSKLVGKPSSCRSFSYGGKNYDAIPKAMIMKAVELSLKKAKQ